ncbi:MAG: hypothetical protein EXR27_02895 [Betaproteobacteria bacterium]|nr:hypothetical protein [Betaproteobacteria bacterium]
MDLGIITTTGVATQRLRPLAVFSEERIKNFPNVPTVRELGHPILPSGYGGLFIRADTPAAIVQNLESVCRDVAADTAYRDLSEKQYQQATYLDRVAFTARLDADFKAKASLMPSLKLPD